LFGAYRNDHYFFALSPLQYVTRKSSGPFYIGAKQRVFVIRQ
jgi:hypothetical protein